MSVRVTPLGASPAITLQTVSSVRPSSRLRAVVSGTGSRTIVLANGFCASMHSWAAIVPQLAIDHRIIQFEYVGSAGSPPDAWNPTRYAELYGHADDVVALLDELGGGPVLFIGHSMGAMIGALAQIAAPDLIHRVVMLGASPRYMDDSEYVGGFPAADIEELITEKEYIAPFSEMRPDMARVMLNSVLLADFRAILPRVSCPVDVIQAAHDDAVPRTVADFLVETMPRANLHLLPISGHSLLLTHRKTVAPLLRQLALSS